VKAPWFFVHILLPHIFLAAIFFGDFWRSGFRVRRRALTTAFVALLAALMIHNTVLLNYYYASDPRERMVTAQTSPEVSRILKLINDVSFRLGTGYDTPMAVKEAAAWPMGWYLRNYKNWYHPGDLTVADKGKAIIIGDWNERESLRSLLGQDYVEMTFPCRGWCIADAKDMTFHKLWRYFMYREAFNSVVYSYLVVYVRRDLSSGYTL
jgi:predicted membrane-bound mannosyltransferase